jgi:hypothetical protein
MRYGTLRKSSISTRGYAEIHIHRPVFDNKLAYENSWIENPNSGNMP